MGVREDGAGRRGQSSCGTRAFSFSTRRTNRCDTIPATGRLLRSEREGPSRRRWPGRSAVLSMTNTTQPAGEWIVAGHGFLDHSYRSRESAASSNGSRSNASLRCHQPRTKPRTRRNMGGSYPQRWRYQTGRGLLNRPRFRGTSEPPLNPGRFNRRRESFSPGANTRGRRAVR